MVRQGNDHVLYWVSRQATAGKGGKGALNDNLPTLKASWQRHVIAASGYSELGMFDNAAMALEEIEPEDKTRKEVRAFAMRSSVIRMLWRSTMKISDPVGLDYMFFVISE